VLSTVSASDEALRLPAHFVVLASPHILHRARGTATIARYQIPVVALLIRLREDAVAADVGTLLFGGPQVTFAFVSKGDLACEGITPRIDGVASVTLLTMFFNDVAEVSRVSSDIVAADRHTNVF
jgi:hypothetical protein